MPLDLRGVEEKRKRITTQSRFESDAICAYKEIKRSSFGIIVAIVGQEEFILIRKREIILVLCEVHCFVIW